MSMLTGLRNAQAIEGFLRVEIEYLGRRDPEKPISDRLLHLIGDEIKEMLPLLLEKALKTAEKATAAWRLAAEAEARALLKEGEPKALSCDLGEVVEGVLHRVKYGKDPDPSPK